MTKWYRFGSNNSWGLDAGPIEIRIYTYRDGWLLNVPAFDWAGKPMRATTEETAKAEALKKVFERVNEMVMALQNIGA